MSRVSLACAGVTVLAILLGSCSKGTQIGLPSVSEVVEKAVNAQGGREAYARVRVVERVSSYRSQVAAGGLAGAPESLVGEAFDVANQRVFIERADAGGATKKYFDFRSGKGWALSPKGVSDLGSGETPTEVAQLQIQFLEGTGFEVFGLSAGESGGSGAGGAESGLKVVGKEIQDGRSVVVLSSTLKQSLGASGDVLLETRYCFDEQSGFLLSKSKTVTRGGGAPIRSEIVYRNYEGVDGQIWLPRLIEMRQQGEFVSEIKVRQAALMPSLSPGVETKPLIQPK